MSWPKLDGLAMPLEEVLSRRAWIGGSDANVILSGDGEAVRALWKEKSGLESSRDLRGNIAVMLGCWTEDFNRQWYEKSSGCSVARTALSLTCDRHPWRRCTLDGYIEELGAVFEAKHTNAFAKPDEVLERYMPQLQHNMAVARAEKAILSVIFGNHKFEIFEVGADWLYQLDLLEAEHQFWQCVLSGDEPVAVAPPPPPKPIGTREVCFDTNNAWASAAADWLENRTAAKLHAVACTTIKGLVEDDVSRAFGHGIEAKRSKSGAVSIRELTR